MGATTMLSETQQLERSHYVMLPMQSRQQTNHERLRDVCGSVIQHELHFQETEQI